jgi:hypothetical protein
VRPEALDAVRGSGIESIAPNPAFARTTITFALAADARARLSVLDVAGREVTRLVHGFQPHGRYQVSWDGTAAGRRLPHGLYFVRLTVDGRDVVRRLVLSQ